MRGRRTRFRLASAPWRAVCTAVLPPTVARPGLAPGLPGQKTSRQCVHGVVGSRPASWPCNNSPGPTAHCPLPPEHPHTDLMDDGSMTRRDAVFEECQEEIHGRATAGITTQ